MLDSLDTLIAFALIFTVVSLLITIVVQMITSLLNLRGKNLAWGIAEAFEAIAPELKAAVEGRGKSLADHLLKDPLISDSQIGSKVKPATAVRADELFDLLHRIATGKKVSNPGDDIKIKDNAVTLFKSLGVPDSVFAVAEVDKARMEAFKVNLEQAVQGLPDGPPKDAANAALQEATAKLANMTTDVTACAKRWADLGEAEIKTVYQKFEHLFETGQERSQDWFTTHARIITGVLGVITAFALQLDTIEIYKLVSSNREVRASLVAQVKPVIDQGERILKATPTVMAQSLKHLGEMTNAASGGNTNNAGLQAITVAASDTPEKVKAKIRDALTNAAPVEVDNVLERFDKETVKEVQAQLKGYSGEYNDIKNSLDKSGFELFPNGGCRWKNEESSWTTILSHLIGMVFSALLLSLGAPFWFNTLKSLASLRSSVAKNISEEDKAEQKNPKAGQTSKLPPTVT